MSIEKPPKHSLWRYKTMGIYRVVGIANEGTTHPRKYPESVVYAGIRDKRLWVRRLDDWYQVMTRVDGGESS